LSFSGAGPSASAATSTNNTSGGASTATANVNRGGFPAPGIVSNPTTAAAAAAITLSQGPDYEDTSEMSEAVDDAFAQLLSIGNVDDPQSEEKVNSAISTIQKMLNNLQKNKQELKFRSIRLMNEAFQNKVVSVPGGLELMMAAGFALVEAPMETSVTATAVAVAGAEEAELTLTLYLKHDMSQQSEAMLDYTVRRLQELQ